MEGPETTAPGPGWRRDLPLLGLLLVLATLARTWVVFSTEVEDGDVDGPSLIFLHHIAGQGYMKSDLRRLLRTG